MGSTRLPGKVLMPLGDSCVLDYVVSRCKLVPGVAEVIVATSVLESDDRIEEWCASQQVRCFRGSEDDVLSRYYDCSRSYAPDYVIRVTADCPFVDYKLAAEVVETMAGNPSDLVVFEGEPPRGLTVEMISYEALERISRIGHEARHREHVTYYAYEYPEQFTKTVLHIPAALRYPHLRITLDTEEDYALCRALGAAFQGRKDIPSSDIVGYLLAHPEVAQLNAHIGQKPVI